MTIGEVAARSAIPASAIRYYEKKGLLGVPVRTSGKRVYDSGVLNHLVIIRFAKETGFTLPETGPHAGLWEIALCRLNIDGSLNTAFGDGGKVITYWPDVYADMHTVAIQTDGKIVVGGDAYGFAAARYQVTKHPTAAIDPFPETGQGAVLGGSGNVRVFPNPASSLLQVQGLDVNSPTILVVQDAAGKKVLTARTEQASTALDIQRLMPGMYYLELMTGDKQMTVPFMKMH